jgi:hypothetical protein
VGGLISLSSSQRERARGEIAIQRITDRNGADLLHVFHLPSIISVGASLMARCLVTWEQIGGRKG